MARQAGVKWGGATNHFYMPFASSQQYRCAVPQADCSYGCGEVYINILRPDLVILPVALFGRSVTTGRPFDAYVNRHVVCAGCGHIQGFNDKYLAEYGTAITNAAAVPPPPPPALTFNVLCKRWNGYNFTAGHWYKVVNGTVEDNRGFAQQWDALKDACSNWEFHIEGVQYPLSQIAPKQQRLCQCGAWATGAKDYTALHDNTRTFTCPAFSMHRPEEEDIVAKVRARATP